VNEPIREVSENSVSVSGLEKVFELDSTVIAGIDQADRKVISARTEGLTIKEASEHYGFAIPTIRLKIKTGGIPARKVDGPKGPEWRIFPQGLPAACEKADISHDEDEDQPYITVNDGSYETDSRLADGLYHANMNVSSLIKANQELSNKLEAANYRIGYLEAQTDNHKEQIKLLTDSQHKTAGWRKFWSWFTGR
jgi:uncharacterized protein (DUF736 family)